MNSMIQLLLLSSLSINMLTLSSAYMEDSAIGVHVESMYRSNAKSRYSSRTQFLDAHTKFMSKFRDSSFKEHDTTVPMIILLQDNCAAHCHTQLQTQSELSLRDQYSVIDSVHAIAHVSVKAMTSIARRLPDTIRDFTPLLPQIKIDKAAAKFCKTVVSLDNKKDSTIVRFRLAVGPQSVVGLQQFKTSLTSLQQQTLSQSQSKRQSQHLSQPLSMSGMSFTYPPEDLRTGRRFYVVITLTTGTSVSTSVEAKKTQAKQAARSDFSSREMTAGSVDCVAVEDLVTQLSELSQVEWVERESPLMHHNRFAKGVCQSGKVYDDYLYNAPDSMLGGNISGLTGEGQIVGIADTGIDFTSCYFHDPMHKPPFGTVNEAHRKVIAYTPYADKYDDSEGHGTHVSGSLAGKSLNNYGDPKGFNGMAPDAKIVFFDIGKTGTAALTTPTNVDTDMFELMYVYGARVFSNSWGSEDNTYSGTSVAVDQFMYTYPDAIAFFAAGNNGTKTDDNGSVQYNTVGAPATCKNCVSVAAGLNDHESWLAYGGTDPALNSLQVADFSSKGPTSDGRLKPDIAAPGWWTASSGSGVTRCLNNSATICPVPLNGPYHCSLKILRGTSMATPTSAGHAVLIRQYFMIGYYPSGRANPEDSFTPSGALLKAMLIHSGQAMAQIISTKTDPTGTKTSVSAQVPVSGYPSNEQGYGRIQVGKVLNFASSSASPISLFVRGAVSNSSALYVALDNTPAVPGVHTQGLQHNYSFTTAPGDTHPPVRVTLVWTDVPGSNGGSNPMVNKLSVIVYQMGASDKFSSYQPASYQSNSYANMGTVAVVDIPYPSAGASFIVSVSVIGRLAVTPQTYALVITAAVTQPNSTMDNGFQNIGVGSTSITPSTVNMIVGMTLAAVLLTFIMVWIRDSDRRGRKHFEETQAALRRSLSPSPDNGKVGHIQPRRTSAAPGSRRPSSVSAMRRSSGGIPEHAHQQHEYGEDQ